MRAAVRRAPSVSTSRWSTGRFRPVGDGVGQRPGIGLGTGPSADALSPDDEDDR